MQSLARSSVYLQQPFCCCLIDTGSLVGRLKCTHISSANSINGNWNLRARAELGESCPTFFPSCLIQSKARVIISTRLEMSENYTVYDEYDFIAGKSIEPSTLMDKLCAIAVLCTLPFGLPVWTLKYFRCGSGLSLGRYVILQALTCFGSLTTPRQSRSIMPLEPLRLLLEKWYMKRACRDFNNYNLYFPIKGASSRWINEVKDRVPSDPVVLYLHGGAYLRTTYSAQVVWCAHVLKQLSSHRLSLLSLDYTVAPYAKYPTQLNEAIACYQQLRKSCNKIIVVGDSAGANLAIALQLWCHEQQIAKPFGVVLLSPWVELVPRDYGSYVENHDRDYLRIQRGTALNFCTPEQLSDPHVNPNRGSPQFWRGVFGPRTINIWGQHEVLRDTCREFNGLAGIKDSFEQPKGVHDVVAEGTGTETTRYVIEHLKNWLD